MAPLSQAYTPGTKHKLSDEKTSQLNGVGITEKLGDNIDLSTTFTNDNGQSVTLADVFAGDLPVLFSVVYYSCPSLCNYHLNGLLDTFKQMDLVAGKDFKLVALSMDHRETSDVATLKKDNYIEEYGQQQAAKGWYFLTGSKENIKKTTDSVGFYFKWDDAQKEYAHASAAIAMTSEGKISRYMHGVAFNPTTVKRAMVEAGSGKVGTIIDQIVLYCFQFDPSLNKYTLYAYNVMRIGGLLTLVLLAVFLGPIWFRESKKA